MTKAYIFDLQVKGQHRFAIMNVRDTTADGDTPICQILKPTSIQKKLWAGHENI